MNRTCRTPTQSFSPSTRSSSSSEFSVHPLASCVYVCSRLRCVIPLGPRACLFLPSSSPGVLRGPALCDSHMLHMRKSVLLPSGLVSCSGRLVGALTVASSSVVILALCLLRQVEWESEGMQPFVLPSGVLSAITVEVQVTRETQYRKGCLTVAVTSELLMATRSAPPDENTSHCWILLACPTS